MTKEQPMELPPEEETAEVFDSMAPTQDPPEEEADLAVEGDDQRGPTELPPLDSGEAELDESEAAAAATWHKGKKIGGLWSNHQNKNSHIHVSGLGWKRLATNHDSCVVALTMLASHARAQNRNVNFKEDKKLVTELYVW